MKQLKQQQVSSSSSSGTTASKVPKKTGGAAAVGSSSNSSKKGSGALQEQIEQLTANLNAERTTREAAEGEVNKCNAQIQRLLSKLDDAEKFKSDEARAMSAARDVHKRLQEENEVLRRLLAEGGKSVEAIEEAIEKGSTAANTKKGGANKAEGGGAKASSSSSKADAAPFDAEKEPAETIPEISFPPASLDPDVVLQSLPQTMQQAFDAVDVQALHAALAALPPAEASEYMRRCVASGLWDPNGGGSAGPDGS